MHERQFFLKLKLSLSLKMLETLQVHYQQIINECLPFYRCLLILRNFKPIQRDYI